MAMELIQYCKKIEVKASYWDPLSRSAFEFARQMNSPKLIKVNPGYECSMKLLHPDSKDPALLMAEFIDGSKLELQTGEFTCAQLRAEFYEKAEEIEEEMERAGTGPLKAGADVSASPGKKDAVKGKAAAKK